MLAPNDGVSIVCLTTNALIKVSTETATIMEYTPGQQLGGIFLLKKPNCHDPDGDVIVAFNYQHNASCIYFWNINEYAPFSTISLDRIAENEEITALCQLSFAISPGEEVIRKTNEKGKEAIESSLLLVCSFDDRRLALWISHLSKPYRRSST